jgi:hypothetical protein
MAIMIMIIIPLAAIDRANTFPGSLKYSERRRINTPNVPRINAVVIRDTNPFV